MYKCSICDNSVNNKNFLVREMMYGYKEQFEYLECSNCGCLQIVAFPPDMTKYYPDDYSSFNVTPPEQFYNPLRKKIKRARDSYAVFNKGGWGRLLCGLYPPSANLQSLSKVRGLKKTSRVLDVGCGNGWLLYSLKEMGIDNVLGIDLYLKKDIAYDNGLKIIKGSIRDCRGEWDLIMFHSSFEHIPDPLDIMQTVSGLLSKDGVCLINIPTVSSYAWRHYGINWVQLDAPRHFFLHSVESIKMLAKKSALTLIDTVFISTEFQFWGSEQYIRDIPLKAHRSYCVNPSEAIFTESEIESFRRRAAELNMQKLGDTALFYLKKSRGVEQC